MKKTKIYTITLLLITIIFLNPTINANPNPKTVPEQAFLILKDNSNNYSIIMGDQQKLQYYTTNNLTTTPINFTKIPQKSFYFDRKNGLKIPTSPEYDSPTNIKITDIITYSNTFDNIQGAIVEIEQNTNKELHKHVCFIKNKNLKCYNRRIYYTQSPYLILDKNSKNTYTLYIIGYIKKEKSSNNNIPPVILATTVSNNNFSSPIKRAYPIKYKLDENLASNKKTTQKTYRKIYASGIIEDNTGKYLVLFTNQYQVTSEKGTSTSHPNTTPTNLIYIPINNDGSLDMNKSALYPGTTLINIISRDFYLKDSDIKQKVHIQALSGIHMIYGKNNNGPGYNTMILSSFLQTLDKDKTCNDTKPTLACYTYCCLQNLVQIAEHPKTKSLRKTIIKQIINATNQKQPNKDLKTKIKDTSNNTLPCAAYIIKIKEKKAKGAFKTHYATNCPWEDDLKLLDGSNLIYNKTNNKYISNVILNPLVNTIILKNLSSYLKNASYSTEISYIPANLQTNIVAFNTTKNKVLILFKKSNSYILKEYDKPKIEQITALTKKSKN